LLGLLHREHAGQHHQRLVGPGRLMRQRGQQPGYRLLGERLLGDDRNSAVFRHALAEPLDRRHRLGLMPRVAQHDPDQLRVGAVWHIDEDDLAGTRSPIGLGSHET
jgi:hypothetical protein